MNKTELIAAIAGKTNVTKAMAGEMVDAFCETVVETVAKGENLQLVGFGTFSPQERKGGERLNGLTGKMQVVEPSVLPRFKPGKGFKDACNVKTSKKAGAKKAAAKKK